MKALTLQSRIIIILIVVTIVTIAVFVTVQLSHEMDTVNRYKEYEATVSSLAIENTWEKILSLSVPPERKIAILKEKIESLKASKTIQDAYLLSKDGKIVFSSDRFRGAKGDSDDLTTLRKLKNGESVQGELVMNQDSRSFSLYVPLKDADTFQYAIRVFFSLTDLSQTLNQVYGPAVLIGILLIVINVVVGFILAHLIIGPIKIFNDAAKNISSGKLGLRVDIRTNDELEELADTFNYMAMELVKMRERAENANPLTKLPGNIVIHEEVEKRIRANTKFTVIYCDLDNFKAFNDKYGILKGDDAIKLTAEVFKDAVKNKGKAEDFIGHEGGDDFILLALPSYAQAIADYITSEFDKRVRALYSKEDLDQGYIVAHARDGSIKQFPIMTISLAGVTNDHRTISSYAEVTNIAAEIKKKAKAEMRSCFIIDQRKAV